MMLSYESYDLGSMTVCCLIIVFLSHVDCVVFSVHIRKSDVRMVYDAKYTVSQKTHQL